MLCGRFVTSKKFVKLFYDKNCQGGSIIPVYDREDGKMNNSNGILIISLDFELYWGLLGKYSLEKYKENLLGVPSVIPRLLKLFKEYQIHCTWAIVGLLYFESRLELIEGLPTKRPEYDDSNLSPYSYISMMKDNESQDIFHFAPALIKMIKSEFGQEIGSHTFSHYYCLEKGQDSDAFSDDLEAAILVARKYGIRLESLVFPKNQINRDYLPIVKARGSRPIEEMRHPGSIKGEAMQMRVSLEER